MDAIARFLPTRLGVLGRRPARHWSASLVAGPATWRSACSAAAQFTRTVPKVYESSTSVLVQPRRPGHERGGGRTKGDINLDTEAQLVALDGRSPPAAGQAAAVHTLAGSTLAANVAVEVPANTIVLVITFRPRTPQGAQAGSHAFAESYLQNRDDSAPSRPDQQISTLSTKLTQLNAQLAQDQPGCSAPLKGSPTPTGPTSRASAPRSQPRSTSLTGRLNQLTTTTRRAPAGSSATPSLPTRPTKPEPAAQPGQRRDGRAAPRRRRGVPARPARQAVRARDDIRAARRPVAVLAAADRPASGPALDDVFAAVRHGRPHLQPAAQRGPGQRPGPGRRRRPRRTQRPDRRGDRGQPRRGVDRGRHQPRGRVRPDQRGDRPRLGAHLPDSIIDTAPLTRMLGVRSIPGLSDVLAGRVVAEHGDCSAPRAPEPQVITTGGTASAGGLLQSQALRGHAGHAARAGRATS